LPYKAGENVVIIDLSSSIIVIQGSQYVSYEQGDIISSSEMTMFTCCQEYIIFLENKNLSPSLSPQSRVSIFTIVYALVNH